MAMRSSYSGSSASESGSSACSRVRTVKLNRRPPPFKLGFSIRGGSEHGTGFFVTSVESGTEAQIQGLVVGDQIIRVNGFPVEDATHREVLQLIQGQNVVSLKVKSVGMIPVKESPHDELTWRIVEGDSPTSSEVIRTELIEDHSPMRVPSDVRMTLKVPPKAKLGCGICKGPEWKPGVFVQFTKENSIARQAGLRPGDQIVQCNNFTFTPDTPFNEAVAVLRCSGILELLVRKGAGLDLFPGESSGYNSSASSVAGDNPWPHRLSVVAEESPVQNHRNGDVIDGPERKPHNGNRTEYMNGCTVIHVNGEDHDGRNKVAEICMVSQQLETKTTTVLVEVHHSEDDDVSNSQSESSTERLTNCSSVSSFASSASSLSSAISQELERRSKRAPLDPVTKAQHPTDKLIKSGLAKEKVHQHEQLMQEFRQAHKKMFSSSDIEKIGINNCEEQVETKPTEPQKRIQSYEVSPQIEKKETGKDTIDGEIFKSKRQAAPPPPPPLPIPEMPPVVKPNLTSTKKYPAPPPPSPPYCPTPDYDTTSLASEIIEDTKPVSKQKPLLQNGNAKPKCDAVEMQSLESFKLTNPSVSLPKPPNTYFMRNSKECSIQPDPSNGTMATLPLRDSSKPMVTIREYPGNKERKSPTKFEFLQNGREPAPTFDANNQPITSRLHSELSQTLSRANLLSKNEPVPSENGLNGHSKGTVVTISLNQQNKTEPPKQAPFYLFPNGNQLNGTDNNKMSKPLASVISKQSAEKLKSIENSNKNSVTFHFGNKDKEAKNVGIVHPNGILKNSTNNVSHIKIHPQQTVDRIPTQKSIKFGGI